MKFLRIVQSVLLGVNMVALLTILFFLWMVWRTGGIEAWRDGIRSADPAVNEAVDYFMWGTIWLVIFFIIMTLIDFFLSYLIKKRDPRGDHIWQLQAKKIISVFIWIAACMIVGAGIHTYWYYSHKQGAAMAVVMFVAAGVGVFALGVWEYINAHRRLAQIDPGRVE
jgi:cation transport ATPase